MRAKTEPRPAGGRSPCMRRRREAACLCARQAGRSHSHRANDTAGPARRYPSIKPPRCQGRIEKPKRPKALRCERCQGFWRSSDKAERLECTGLPAFCMRRAGDCPPRLRKVGRASSAHRAGHGFDLTAAGNLPAAPRLVADRTYLHSAGRNPLALDRPPGNMIGQSVQL